jgi:hypothetical protein
MQSFYSTNEVLKDSQQLGAESLFSIVNYLILTFLATKSVPITFVEIKLTAPTIKIRKFKILLRMNWFFLKATIILFLLKASFAILVRYDKQDVLTQSWVTFNIQHNVQ